MPPTFANGKICYVEIPALDVARSAEFYERVFGWGIRRRGDGSVAFDDGVGEVASGSDARVDGSHHGEQHGGYLRGDRRKRR